MYITITPGKFEGVFFMFKSVFVNPKNLYLVVFFWWENLYLVVFFWCRREQKGTGGADIHTITMWRKGYVGALNWEVYR